MNLLFILLLLPLTLTSGYHDSNIYPENRFFNDDDAYWSDDYDYYIDFSGYGENFQTISIENLRRDLFTNYSKNTRPVIDYHDAVELKYGIEIVSLDYFDQKAESIE